MSSNLAKLHVQLLFMYLLIKAYNSLKFKIHFYERKNCRVIIFLINSDYLSDKFWCTILYPSPFLSFASGWLDLCNLNIIFSLKCSTVPHRNHKFKIFFLFARDLYPDLDLLYLIFINVEKHSNTNSKVYFMNFWCSYTIL